MSSRARARALIAQADRLGVFLMIRYGRRFLAPFWWMHRSSQLGEALDTTIAIVGDEPFIGEV